MEILIVIVSFSLVVGLILFPIYLLRQINKTKIRFKFITFLSTGLILTALIAFVFAWWSYTSDLLLLKHYGYDIDGMNETEFYGKVLPENMDKVKSLEISIMGIGWPLKAFLTFIFYSPYLLIVYIIMYLIEIHKLPKLKRRKENDI
jgi:amino acid transporter